VLGPALLQLTGVDSTEPLLGPADGPLLGGVRWRGLGWHWAAGWELLLEVVVARCERKSDVGIFGSIVQKAPWRLIEPASSHYHH
jgi:hypothetical protein